MSRYSVKPRWTKTQELFLEENFDKMKDEDMARIINKSLKAIRRKREEMGLVKSGGRGKYGAQPKPESDLPDFLS